MIHTLNPSSYSFKDSLFESVSFQPWSLEYKMMFTETRLMLEDAFKELYAFHSARYRLLEADTGAETPAEIINRFEKLVNLSQEHFGKLAHHVNRPKDDPPPGWLNRFLNMIKNTIERVSKLYEFPNVEAKIQEVVQKAMDKAQDKGFGKLLNPVLRGLKNLADTMKGTWVPSLVLVVLGIAVSLLTLPAFIGGGLWVFSIIMILARIVADLVKGKTLAYSFTKAVALYGAGYAAAELFKYVMPMITSALSATPPATPGGEAVDALSQTDAVRAMPTQTPMPGAGADEFTAGLPNVPVPGDGADQFTQGGTPALVSTGNAYIDGLQRLYGEPIKQFGGSFNQAFADARDQLGAGKIFSWFNSATGKLEPFTTNTAIPGSRPGQLNLAGLSTAVVNYLTRTR